MPTESVYDLRIRGLRRIREEEWGRDRIDLAIGELARLQYGVVARWQLLDAGVGKRAIERRLASGRLAPSALGRLLGRSQTHSEARLVDGRRPALGAGRGPQPSLRCSPLGPAELHGTSNRDHRSTQSSSSKLVRRHVSHLPPDERTAEEGIPVTTVPRTILDLAATEPLVVVKALLREMEYRELWGPLSLWDLVERYPGRRGIRKVASALEGLKDEPVGEQKSPLEERFAPFCRRHRLPLPHFNAPITVAGKTFQLDCHWPGTSQIVELDGWQGHKSRSAFREDRHRDRILSVHGYTVTHLTWNQLDDEPEAIASDLRSLLGTDR